MHFQGSSLRLANANTHLIVPANLNFADIDDYDLASQQTLSAYRIDFNAMKKPQSVYDLNQIYDILRGEMQGYARKNGSTGPKSKKSHIDCEDSLPMLIISDSEQLVEAQLASVLSELEGLAGKRDKRDYEMSKYFRGMINMAAGVSPPRFVREVRRRSSN